MAKGVYKKWLESDNLLLLQGWKYKGLTDEQIASNIGIAPRTLERWKNSYSQICQALKKGKEHANYAVENALFKKAIDENTTAMIFWLKNNYREKYSDSQKTPLEEQLTEEQIRRAEADADVARAKADILTGSAGSNESTIIIDDIGDDSDDSESESDDKQDNN